LQHIIISKMRNISLRAADEADWTFVAALTEECMRVYAEQTWGNWFPERQDQFNHATHQIVVVDGREIGCVSVVEHAGFTSLEKLYISKKYQNQGIDTALLAQVFEQARKQAGVLRLRVLRVNPARKFYVKHGFQVTDETRERLFMTRVFADDSDA
jgi:GNAT superfamily N-acetyltransferase